MRRGGYIVITDPEGGNREYDTITCFHCQMLVHWSTRSEFVDRTGGCGQCGKVICLPCVNLGVCTPWEKQMQQAEDRSRFRREAGLN